MKVPKGWFLLYPPKYRTPSVFDLHERGERICIRVSVS